MNEKGEVMNIHNTHGDWCPYKSPPPPPIVDVVIGLIVGILVLLVFMYMITWGSWS